MAKQFGVISLKGSIGDTTFVQTKNGFFARKKTGVTKDMIMKSPQYARLRDHMAEFATAAKASKLLRENLLQFIGRCRDSRMATRLSTLMLAAVKLDRTNPLGERNMLDGEVALLEKFEFNGSGNLAAVMQVDVIAGIDRANGNVSVNIDALTPDQVMKWPPAATHYRIAIAGISINFESGVVNKNFLDGDFLPVGKQLNDAVSLGVSLPGNLAEPILLVLKLEFFTEVNGGMNPLNDGSFNSCSILRVNTGV